MRKHYRGGPAVATVALLLCATLADAGVVDRLRRAGSRGTRFEGKALTGPIATNPGSMEVDVWVFSAHVGRAITRVRFPSTDVAKVTKKVRPGALVVVLDGDLLPSEERIVQAFKWRVEPNPDELESAFLATYMEQILAYGLRASPHTLRLIFGDDSGDLRQLGLDIDEMRSTLAELGVYEIAERCDAAAVECEAAAGSAVWVGPAAAAIVEPEPIRAGEIIALYIKLMEIDAIARQAPHKHHLDIQALVAEALVIVEDIGDSIE